MGTIDPCRKIICALLVCLLIVNELNAKEQCKKGCPTSDSGKLKYQPGNVYEYNFDSVVTISVTGSDSDETSLKVLGHANVFAGANCEYTLQLDKVVVNAAKDSFRKQVTQDVNKPVQFTLSSGVLEPQICGDKSESDFSLNIKRAIISMLQSSEKDHETDVFGVCPTSTKVTNVGGANIVTKVRNLNSCGYRESVSNGLISGVVNEKAGVKTTALLTGEYTKEQKINNGIIENVELHEDYRFVPTSVGNAGAKAKVKTSMKLIKQGTGAAPPVNGVPYTIIFKHPRPVPTKNIDALKKVYETTVNQVDGYTKADAARLFTELIRLMRSADSDTLTDLSGIPHQNKNLAKQVYLDALFRTATSESVKAIVRQVPKMTEKEKKMALLSFNLVESVTKDALNKAAGLLGPGASKEAFLAVGNLVHKYCSENSCEDAEINGITKKFTDNLKQCKANTRAEEDRIVYILKGIRNAQRVAASAEAPLFQCVTGDHSSRIRVAALQAFTAAGCNPAVQQKALSILRDRNEDSEIRIEAYLAAVSCPNAELANHLAEILNSETVHQVGGFITTHLRGIRDSTDSTREAARYYLGNIRISKKFPIDPRRYSFNSELSYALESLGVGASADYNLIYSQHGFLPRSGRLNLTSEVFGKRFNVLEFSARQENLESLLEYYFGPKGYIQKDPKALIDKVSSLVTREKRSVSDDATKFSKNYKPYGGKIDTDINLDLSMKMFGSEFFFLSLGDNIPTNAGEFDEDLKKMFNKAKDGAKKFEHNCQCHSMFLDTEIVYPSGIGLPIELVAQGTAAGSLNIASELDIDGLIKDSLNNKARVKVVPSVDLNVNGQLRVVSSVVTTGVRVATNLHSAAGSDVQFQLHNSGNQFDLDIELPRRNIDLIELKHDIEFFVADRERPTKSFPMKHKKKAGTHVGTFDQLQMFGLTVDFSATVPEVSAASAPLLLNGPIHVAVKLESEPKISFKGVHDKTDVLESWQLTYDTPGSKVPHTSALKFEIGATPKGDPNMKIHARGVFDNPQKRLAVEVGLVDNQQELLFYGQYEHDTDKNLAKIGFTKNGNEYRPIIQTISKDNQARNEIAGYKADGRVIAEKSGEDTKYKLENVRVTQPKGEPVVMNGWMTVGSNHAEEDVEVSTNGQTYKVKAQAAVHPGVYTFKGYVTDNANAATYGGGVTLKMGSGIVNADINLKAGQHEFDTHHKYEWEQNPETNTPNNMKFENELKLKGKDTLEGSVKLNGLVKPNHINYDFAAARQEKKVAFFIDYIQNEKSQGDYKLDVNGQLNKHFIDVKAKCDIKGGRAHVDNSVSSSWGTQITARGVVGQRFSAQDVEIDLQGTAILTSKDKATNWILKANGSPEKTVSELKITRENAELVSFNGELNRPADKPMNGKLNLSVKDALVAKGDFKLAKNGRGDLSMVVNLKKMGKKLKADSKFLIQSPKYDVETTVYFDPDKDKSKKLYYKTENIVDKMKFSTKNILELGPEKYTLDASAALKGEYFKDGEEDYKFVVTVPSGRQFDGDLKRKYSTKNDVTSGLFVGSFNDKLPSNQKRTIAVETKLDSYNPKLKTFSAHSRTVLTNFDGKTAEYEIIQKHLPKGHFKMAELNFKSKGDLLEAPVELQVNIDEYCEEHAIFRISSKYSDRFTANANGNYQIGPEKPKSYEVQLNVNAPTTLLRSYVLQSSGKFVPSKDPKEVHEGEIHFYEKIGENDPFKLDANVKGNTDHGSYHLATQVPKHTPVKLDGTYLQESNDKSGKYQYTFKYDYDQGKVITSSIDLNAVDQDTINFHYSLQTPYDNAKNIDLVFKGKTSNDDTFTTSSQLNYNGQNYGLNSVITMNERKSAVDITASSPEKTAKFSSNAEMFGDRKGQASLKLEEVFGISFVGSAEAAFEGFDDFYLKADIDSEKLKINQLHIEANSQKGSGGKGVTFLVKDAQQQIISGTATYNVKHEKGKAIVEGQGSIQYHEKATNANFKLVRQNFELGADKEAGFAYTFNGTFGPKNVVSTLKITNKNFHVKLACCEEKKQCTNFEVQSVVTIQDQKRPDQLQHEIMVLIDLRELGYPHEFELQSKTTRSGFKVEHEIEANIISNNNNKYQLIANLKPTNNRIQIAMPKRDIVLETKHQSPQKGILGKYEESIVFYFDKKNKPNEKTQLLISGEVSGIENVALNGKAAAKFEHPTIRPLQIAGTFDLNKSKQLAQSQITFDVFRAPNQKIVALTKYQGIPQEGRGFNVTTENTIKSAGLGFDYTISGHSALSVDRQELSVAGTFVSTAADLKAGAYLHASKDQFELLVNALNAEVLSVNGNYQKNKGKLDSKLKFLGSKPLTLSGEIEPSKLEFELKQEGVFEIEGEIKPTKEVKFAFEGAGKKLYNARIALDPAHFLATTYEVNHDDVKSFMKNVEEQVKQDTEHARSSIDKQFQKVRQYVEQQMQAVKGSAPELAKLQHSYKEHLTDILKELEEDPVLRDFVGVYRRTYEAFMQALQEVIKATSETFTKTQQAASDLYAKVSAALKDQILPEFQAYIKRVTSEIGQLYAEAVKILGSSMEQSLKALKSVEADLAKIGKPLQEALKPIVELINELSKTIAKEWEDFWKEAESYYKTLPTLKELYNQAKEKVGDVTFLNDILPVANEAINQLQEYVTTEEGKEFLAKLHEYVDAKLKKEEVNDMEKLEELYAALLNAVRSFLMSLQSEGVSESLFSPLPYTADIVRQIPGWVTFKFSPFNFLRNQKIDSISDLLLYRPLLDVLPPFELRGTVADGEHVFTFDGRHIAFPGSCKYILAQDYVNNNFSVIANLKEGKMKSIILVDKSNFVEINDQGAVKLNGQPAELPLHKEDMHAWRRYYTINILSEYGVNVMCSTNLRVCHVHINGFYTGRTRGLLGNGNAEPYDDFTQPNGVITENYADFGNAYGIGSCAPLAAQPHEHEMSPICKELFDLDSTLILGYLFIDPTIYRRACNHAVEKAANKEDVACNLAYAYASNAHLENLPVATPPQCVKCNPNTPEQRDLGATFESKVPENKADVVFVVDTAIGKDLLTDLVTPVISELRTQLKNRGITDVHTAVIGYDQTRKYPSLFTTHGKLNFQGKLSDINMEGPKYEEFEISTTDRTEKIVEEIRKGRANSLVSSDAKAFNLAMDYPFRAAASKVIVIIRDDHLEYLNPIKAFGAALTNELVKAKGISIHLIGPVKEVALDGVPSVKIVGFNSRVVATPEGRDAKKRSKLQYRGDMGVDFVHSDGGWVFPLQNFKQQKSPEQKKAFTHSISSNIAEQTSKLEVISDCRCNYAYGLYGEDTCISKSTQFITGRKAAAARG